jgi:HEAT repeat protein
MSPPEGGTFFSQDDVPMRNLLLMTIVLVLLVVGWLTPCGAQDASTVKDLNDAAKAVRSDNPVDRAAGMCFFALYGRQAEGYSRDVVKGLLDSNADVRMWAAKGLPLVNPDLAAPVLALVKSQDYDNRVTAVQELAKMGDKGAAALPALLAFLPQAQASDRVKVVKTLAEVGAKDQALPALLVKMAIKDSDPAVRQVALRALPKMANSQLVADSFAEYLKDSDPAQRAAAVTALGDQDKANPQAIRALQQAMRDPSPTVRAAAKSALDRLQAKKP